MVHVSDTAAKIVADLDKNGWKGIDVTARFFDERPDRELLTTVVDGEPAEMTPREFDDRLRDYATFTVEPDFLTNLPDNELIDNDLVVAEMEFKFWSTLRDRMKAEFGPGVKIDHDPRGCSEFEVSRVEAAHA